MPVTVVTPAASGDLTTLEALDRELSGEPDTARDVRLAEVIRQVSAAAAAYCGLDTFGRERVRQTERSLWGCRAYGRSILLERWIRPSIVSVEVDGVALDTAEYEVDGALLYRLTAGGSPYAFWAGQIAVTYDTGFDCPAGVPPDLQRIALDLCVGAHQTRSRDAGLRRIRIMDLVEKEYFGTQATAATGGMPGDVATRLEKYRRVMVS